MKREAVTYVAAVAAAVSLAALGYAVVWGVDPADLGPPMQTDVAPPLASGEAAAPPEMEHPLPRPRPRDVVLAPDPAGQDQRAPASPPSHGVSTADPAAPAAGQPPAASSGLAPSQQATARPPGADARPAPGASPHVADRAVAMSAPLKPLLLGGPIGARQTAILPQDAPAALSASAPVGAAEPPAGPERLEGAAPAPERVESAVPAPERVESVPSPAPIVVAPRSPQRPAPRLTLPRVVPQPKLRAPRTIAEYELEPPPGVTITRGAEPTGPVLAPPQSASLPPAGPRLATGERELEPPPGITITRGAPPAGEGGPLMIQAPARARR